MTANVKPIYTRTADVQWITAMVTANNTIDLTSGTSYLVFTADATEGGFVREVRIKPSPSQNTATTVARLWINNGSTTATAANSILFTEQGIPSTTTSATQPQSDFVIPVNLALPPGYKLYITLGTAPGGSGQFGAVAIAGKY